MGAAMLHLRHLAPLIVLTLCVSACSTSGATVSPTTSTTAALVPGAKPSAAAGPSGSVVTRQTDTEWGRIWDALPTRFPKIPGSTPANETATGPASATLVVDGNVAKAVATSTESNLRVAAYRTDALSGPLEDGTYTLEMTGAAAGCRIMVTAKPTGGVTTVTILYGSACPAP